MSNYNEVETKIREVEKSCSANSQKLAEYEKGMQRILDTLEKIQVALVGELGQDSPGFIEDLRTLKKQVAELTHLKGDVESLRNKLVKFQQDLVLIKELKSEMGKTKKFQDFVRKWFWQLTGAAYVLYWLISNKDKVVKLLQP